VSAFTVTAGAATVSYSDREAAGAIHSLIWGGVEFLNRADDGRLLQAACSCDRQEEGFNPTEGGALSSIQFDTTSASRLVMHAHGADWLETVTRMAFWKPVAGAAMSNYDLHKRVSIGANVLNWEVSFHTPTGETHQQLQMELVTGYMPPEFSAFFGLDVQAGSIVHLSDGPGEQMLPVILSYPDGSYAMGVRMRLWAIGEHEFVGGAPPPANCGYGRWRFPAPDNCVKWNAVARVNNPVMGSVFTHTAAIGFGTLADVVRVMSEPRGVLAGQVRRLYWATLGRAPDDGGFAFQLAQLQAGMPLASVAAGFVTSPEFQAKYGNTDDTAFVTLLYRNVLGREPDAGGLQFQLAQLAAGRRARNSSWTSAKAQNTRSTDSFRTPQARQRETHHERRPHGNDADDASHLQVPAGRRGKSSLAREGRDRAMGAAHPGDRHPCAANDGRARAR
jgi:hypothetical protein